ncbi:helix-turn-helix transcriptional regulator [Nocardia sp. N2S4-5]|uniref:helix-turn-helix transcriptional regulator n=1 Tax=Nocardia sp. N2S4-5 TaxID=3351565 RepID=UPI0037CECA96
MADRSELAAFLRARRARLQPRDVGLPDGLNRRTAGLRRQEVAQLAGLSVDYYVRLEQARGSRPSRQVLSALSRALLLSTDEREYLFRMAGENPPPHAGPNRVVPPSVRIVLDNLTATPAYVVDATYEILAWNAAAVPFIGDLDARPDQDRNMIRWIFRQPDDHPHWDDDSATAFARSTVADLRAAYARYPGNRALAELVTELLGTAPRFARMWSEHEVEVRRGHRKNVRHPLFGPLEFECQVLHISDTDQRMILYCADPGSPADAVFRRIGSAAGAPAS